MANERIKTVKEQYTKLQLLAKVIAAAEGLMEEFNSSYRPDGQELRELIHRLSMGLNKFLLIGVLSLENLILPGELSLPKCSIKPPNRYFSALNSVIFNGH